MPSGEIVSDETAARIAQALDVDAWTPMARFANRGEIDGLLAEWADERVAMGLRRLPGESNHLWERRWQLHDLARYAAHHGVRGPVDGWPSEDGVS
jgi:hypothetical protein